MTQEEKQLLLKDISARLKYGVICEVEFKDSEGWKQMDMILSGVFENECYFTTESGSTYSREFKPYLRPMSSMTEEEKNECINLIDIISSPSSESDKICKIIDCLNENIRLMDWLNKHHFDYRGLIEKGLAIEAPGNMYTL